MNAGAVRCGHRRRPSESYIVFQSCFTMTEYLATSEICPPGTCLNRKHNIHANKRLDHIFVSLRKRYERIKHRYRILDRDGNALGARWASCGLLIDQKRHTRVSDAGI